RKAATPAIQSLPTRSETPTRTLTDGSIAIRPKQAARLAGICRSNLFRAIRDGHLPARKYGRCTLILVQDLWAWLEQLPGIAEGRNHQAGS
ncbi:MAG TPA: helix-turn-helix domain-containing protein, partial [Pseudolabrys sp.]|nr:helix-turn-helix domain-containing protein [Pseudolabrys sp.]